MSLRHSTDAELIAACLSGSAPAWDTLIDRYESLLFTVAICMGLSRPDAEDVFQNVCLLLLDHLGELRDTTRLSGWLVTTTKREALRMRRQPGSVLLSGVPEHAWNRQSTRTAGSDADSSPEATVIALEERQRVRQALLRLPEQCCQLLSLLYCHQPPYSYAETAHRLALPLGAIGPSRARCLQKLRKILEEESS